MEHVKYTEEKLQWKSPECSQYHSRSPRTPLHSFTALHGDACWGLLQWALRSGMCPIRIPSSVPEPPLLPIPPSGWRNRIGPRLHYLLQYWVHSSEYSSWKEQISGRGRLLCQPNMQIPASCLDKQACTHVSFVDSQTFHEVLANKGHTNSHNMYTDHA